MLHNNAAQQRPGEKPVSAPFASQIAPRAQGRAKIPIPTLKHPYSRYGETNAGSLTDGNMDTTHIIHIRGAHSPPPQLDLMTHTAPHTQQQLHGPKRMLQQNSVLPPRLARYHPLGEGYGQARSVLGPEQGKDQGKLPRHATKDLQQNPEHSHLASMYYAISSRWLCSGLWHNTWTHQASQPDSDKHIMHTAPPAPRHSRHDNDDDCFYYYKK